jgi:nitrogen fixation NifU-like protein
VSLDALDALYKEVILDHYQNPRNAAPLDDPSVATEGFNPVCGDQVHLELLVQDGQILGVSLNGKGCAISQSSASMMTEAVVGRDLEDADGLAKAFRDYMTGADDTPARDLGDLEVLDGVRKFPVRVKCATLGWNTLQEALKEYRAGLKAGKLVIEEGDKP